MAIFHQIKPKYKTRNDEIVAGLFAAAGADAPAPPETVIKRKAAEISTLMALIHGGDWRVEIDHQAEFVLIAPRLP
ncbi:MAG: hypothetical protein BGP09_31285 [Rhizobium sp. 60-20]|nr:MAG: hypothetical protein BGP09_31285 [Rhizobium sp. 60-20]